jgi:hypothetical protein
VRVNNHQIEVISTHRKIGHSPSISRGTTSDGGAAAHCQLEKAQQQRQQQISKTTQ